MNDIMFSACKVLMYHEKKTAIDKNVFCKLNNKQNANLRSNVAFFRNTVWDALLPVLMLCQLRRALF